MSATITTSEFRDELRARLQSAIDMLRDVEPEEFNADLVVLDDHLLRIGEFIEDTIRPPEQRRQEEEESDRARRIRMREQGLDKLQMLMDERLQRLANLITCRAPGPILRGDIALLVLGLVDVLDRCPASMWGDDAGWPLITQSDRARVILEAVDRAMQQDRGAESA